MSDVPVPTWRKRCQKCDRFIERWQGQQTVECGNCGAQYNASGQRLRDDWQDNPSNYDDEVGDLEGMESAELRAERYESDRLEGMYFEPEYRDGGP